MPDSVIEASRLSPQPTLVAVLLAVLLIDLVVVLYMLSQPSMGVELEVRDEQVVIVKVRPAHNGLLPGREIIALKAGAQRLELEPGDLIEEPDLHAEYAGYNRFMARQQQLVEILEQPGVIVEMADGQALEIDTQPRQLTWLPLSFWLQLLVASVASVTGAALWLFRRGDRAALHYMLSGSFLAVVIFPAAIYSSRELALPGDMFRLLSVVDHLGLYLTMAAVVSLLWTYPRVPGQWPLVKAIYLIMALCWVLDTLQWFPSLDISTRVVALLMLLLGVAILVLHWRRSQGDTLYRQSIKWFLLLVVVGCGLFVMTVFFPPLIGYPPLVSQSIAFLAFLMIYIGLAFGVARFRLFDLDRWWFEVWYWVALGGLLFVIELSLVSWLSLTQSNALLLALVVIAWAYFPLRQGLLRRLLGRNSRGLEDFLPLIVREISGIDNPEDIGQAYRRCLTSIYSPLDVNEHEENVPQPGIIKNGLSLLCPAPGGQGAIELHCADQGRRLFSSVDLGMVEALVDLFSQVQESKRERAHAIQEERERIKQDMHDTIGGRLLSIMRIKNEPRSANLATNAWRELRDILSALEGAPVMLSQALDQWQRDSRRQLDDEGIGLRWRVDDELREQSLQLNGFQRLHLGQILREALNNALRHGSPGLVEAHYAWRDDCLLVEICNDGVSTPPEEWLPGRGLHHIRHRAERLGASVQWSMRDNDRVALLIELPLGGKR